MLLDEFLTMKTAAGLSASTVEWYGYMLRPYLDWLDGDPPDGATAQVIRRFLAAERGTVSASTIAGRYRALSAFYAWMVADGLIEVSPVERVSSPKVPKTEPRRADLSDLERMIATMTPAQTWIDLRDRLIVRLLFWTGLRLAELSGLDVGDVDLVRPDVLVRGGKGGKDRRVPLHPSIPAQIGEYLFNRPQGTGFDALLLGTYGSGRVRGRLGRSGIRRMLQRRAEESGIPYWNPHSYRHAAAMAMLNDAQMELGIVSKILGHSSPEITRTVYADWLDDSVQRAFNQAVDRMAKNI